MIPRHYCWRVDFDSTAPSSSFPIIRCIASEEVFHKNYRLNGAKRGLVQNDDFHVCKLTLQGQGKFTYHGKEYDIREGDCFICHVCDPEISYFYPPESCQPWQFIFVTFYGGHELVKDLIRQHGPVFHLGNDSQIFRDLSLWKRKNDCSVLLSPSEATTPIFQLLTALQKTKESKQNLSVGEQLVKSTLDLINHKINEPINVNTIAEELSVSSPHLCRTFKKVTGKTVNFYIQDRKMKAVCRLLKDTTISVKEVGSRFGYENTSHFCRTFRNHFKITPGAYRKSEVQTIL